MFGGYLLSSEAPWVENTPRAMSARRNAPSIVPRTADRLHEETYRLRTIHHHSRPFVRTWIAGQQRSRTANPARSTGVRSVLSVRRLAILTPTYNRLLRATAGSETTPCHAAAHECSGCLVGNSDNGERRASLPGARRSLSTSWELYNDSSCQWNGRRVQQAFSLAKCGRLSFGGPRRTNHTLHHTHAE
jgi:hypothetical protein